MAVEILKCATAKIFFWLWRFNFLAKSGCGDLNFQKLKVAVESVGTAKNPIIIVYMDRIKLSDAMFCI